MRIWRENQRELNGCRNCWSFQNFTATKQGFHHCELPRDEGVVYVDSTYRGAAGAILAGPLAGPQTRSFAIKDAADDGNAGDILEG